MAPRSEETLTSSDRRFVLLQRANQVVNRFYMSFERTAWNATYVQLCGGDIAAMAINRGQTAVINNFAGMWCAPLVAQLSDSIGRKWLMVMGRAGTVVFFATLPHHKRRWTRMLIECLAWGVFGAGHWAMFTAARSDLFGESPDLMSRIELTDQTFANISGFVGQLAGVAVSARFGHYVAMYLTAALAASSILLIALQKETLLPENRKPFTLGGVLRKGNPLSNLHLLLGHGVGLRKLTAMVAVRSHARD